MADFVTHLRDAAPQLVLLVFMEGLLSVDNMLAIASLASDLPGKQKRAALRLGLLGAYVFRALALIFATVVVRSQVMMVLGAAYLVHLAAFYFVGLGAVADGKRRSRAAARRTFWETVVAIQFLDLSLSLDNVVVAVGVAPGQPWIVYTGVALGLVTLWLFATLSLRLIEDYPVLKHAAFLLVGFIGVLLLIECVTGLRVGKLEKFLGSCVIIALCLWYERSPWLRKCCQPVFAAVLVPLRRYERLWRAVSVAALRIFRRVRALFVRAA